VIQAKEHSSELHLLASVSTSIPGVIHTPTLIVMLQMKDVNSLAMLCVKKNILVFKKNTKGESLNNRDTSSLSSGLGRFWPKTVPEACPRLSGRRTCRLCGAGSIRRG
jgi:hypothetical protein